MDSRWKSSKSVSATVFKKSEISRNRSVIQKAMDRSAIDLPDFCQSAQSRHCGVIASCPPTTKRRVFRGVTSLEGGFGRSKYRTQNRKRFFAQSGNTSEGEKGRIDGERIIRERCQLIFVLQELVWWQFCDCATCGAQRASNFLETFAVRYVCVMPCGGKQALR